MNELSLFTGAGGGCLASKLLGHRIVGYVEWDSYCCRVLAQRIKEGFLDEAPIFGDVRAFVRDGYAASYQGLVDVVSGGFPCQPHSVAGKRRGAADERDMWPAFRDVVAAVRPRYVFAENVPGLLGSSAGDPDGDGVDETPSEPIRYFGTVLRDLAEIGYGVRWTVLGADDIGAPHRRKRLWILADALGGGCVEDGQRRGVAGVGAKRQDDAMSPAESGMADASRDGRVEGWPKSAGEQGRPDAAECCDVADATGTGLQTERPTRTLVGGDVNSGGQGGWWSLDPADLPDAEGERRTIGELPRPHLEHDGQEPTHGSGEASRRPIESRVGCVVDGLADQLGVLGTAFGGCIPRVAVGVAKRVDRLRALGNGQVPMTAAVAWLLLTEGLDR